MRFLSHFATLLIATVSTLGAQTLPGHALVVTEGAGPVINLLDVDLDTGDISFFGSFASKFNKPLAVEIDPINQDIILAIADGPNSRILRLFPQGQRITGEQLLAEVPGWVSNLVLKLHSNTIIASVIGHQQAIYRIPRNGGAAELVLPMPRATAIGGMGWIAQSADLAPGGSDPQIQNIDLVTGRVVIAPVILTNFPVDGLTGIVQTPSALGFVIITDSGGSLTRASGFTPHEPLNVTPQLPPGSTIAIELQEGFRTIVLGGDAHPFLKTTDVFSTSPLTWQILAGPLPDSPRDFDIAAPAQAELLQFAESCIGTNTPVRPVPRLFGSTPRLGNLDFQLSLHSAEPGQQTFLIFGRSEKSFLGIPLPIILPAGGCELLVSANRVFPATSDAMGSARVQLPIRDDPALNGATFFAQWAILNGNDLEMTNAVAIRIFASR